MSYTEYIFRSKKRSNIKLDINIKVGWALKETSKIESINQMIEIE